MGIFDIFRKKKKAAGETDPEARFRENLLRSGRITDGEITEVKESESGEIIAFYTYSVQGADFESTEILNEEQKKDPIKYAPGASVGVRYNPRQHGSSILV